MNGAGDPESFVPATLRSLATAAVTTILLSGVKVAVLPPRPLLPVVRFHGGSGGFGGSAGAPLVPNVALTIEPGLYFPADEARWGRLAGVGMRLEDEIVVRARKGGKGEEQGPEVLSAGAPLLPADVAAAIDGS